MKRLILIFIFVSGINLFAQANFSLYIYKGKANYLKGYNIINICLLFIIFLIIY